MSTYFYDDALVRKLKQWTANTSVTITSPDETRQLFEVLADISNDKPLKFPLICVKRVNGYQLLSTVKTPLTYDGLTKEANTLKSKQLNAVPITLSYQIDVFTRYFREADEYIRNLVFNIINYPTLSVEIPYESIDIEHNAYMTLLSDVTDNGNIQERLSVGQFVRMSLQIQLTDAYLFDVRTRDNCSIGFRISDDKDNNLTDYNIDSNTDSFPPPEKIYTIT